MRSSGSLRRSWVAKAYSMRILALDLEISSKFPMVMEMVEMAVLATEVNLLHFQTKFLMRRRRPNRNLFQPLRVAWKRVSWWAGTRRACCPGRLHSKTFTKNGWSQAHPLGRCLLSMCEYTFWTLLSPMYFFFRVAARLCFLTCDISASGTNGMHCQQLLVPWANFFLGQMIFFSWGFFFCSYFFWRANTLERESSGKMSELYRSLCAKEQEQMKKNPELKSVYEDIFDQIRTVCMQFQNESSSVKIHLPKAAPRTRKGKPAKVEPVE